MNSRLRKVVLFISVNFFCFVGCCVSASISEDVHHANSVSGDLPELDDDVLLRSLQYDEDEDVGVWSDQLGWMEARGGRGRGWPGARSGKAIDKEASRASCHRPCEEDGEPFICYFRWRVEAYATMGRACGDCPRNVSHCTAPQCITADGFERGVLSVNRKIPGPSIHVCKGDIVVVDVKNLMPGRSTTVHWHGIRQRGSPHMDGVPMVTQCPISEYSIFRYRFVANDVGTHFWHSHDGMQKMDGLAGALVVRAPRSMDPHGHLFDYDLRSHTLLISDWFHLDADQRFPGLRRREVGQFPDSYLINGRGNYRLTVDSETPYTLLRVTRGRRYRLRLIGASSTSCAFSVSVESHRLTLLYAESTPVVPVQVDSVSMSSGERFDVLLVADQPVGAYWIHVRGLGPCALVGAHQVAVLRYSEAPLSMPMTPNPGNRGLPNGVILNPENSVCEGDNPKEVCLSHLRSVRPAPEGILDQKVSHRVTLEFGFYFFNDVDLYGSNTFQRHFHPPLFPPAAGTVNNITNMLGPAPLLSQMQDIPKHLLCADTDSDSADKKASASCRARGVCQCLHLVRVPLGGIVELVIADSNKRRGVLSHPFHLHGNYFHVLAQGLFEPGQEIGDIVELLEEGEIPFSMFPVQKDTMAIPSGGYVVVRMFATNPGYWLFHCHFLYHLATGMSVVMQVGDVEDMTPTPRGFPKCGDFFG